MPAPPLFSWRVGVMPSFWRQVKGNGRFFLLSPSGMIAVSPGPAPPAPKDAEFGDDPDAFASADYRNRPRGI